MNLVYDVSTNTMFASINGTTTTTQDSWYSIDVTTGAATLIGSYAASATNINGLAYDVDNNIIYAVDNSTDLLYTMDRATGIATPVGSVGSANLLGLVWLPGTGTYSNFATGCAGTLGIPGNFANRAANLGHDLSLTGTNLPFDACAMIVGFSNTTYSGFPLPLDLAVVGAPGCFGYVSADFINLVFGAPGSNTATFTAPVPNDNAFLGLPYFAQTYSFDTVNSFGFVAGDAGGGLIGH